MPKCAFAGCDERDDLVARQSERNRETYHYCDDHDPLDDVEHSFAFSEVDGDA
jgi:hypothetical protein